MLFYKKKYVADYFLNVQKVVCELELTDEVTIQFFQREGDRVFCGIKEVLNILRSLECQHPLLVRYLPEGEWFKNEELCLEITGRYSDFMHLEGVIDGVLSRATSVATRAAICVAAANGKKVVCFSDRSDHFLTQSRDGYAAYIGGIRGFSSDAQVSDIVAPDLLPNFGSTPHSFIQLFKGDLVKALLSYKKIFPEESLVALLDYNNDVLGEVERMVKEPALKNLSGVRIDTSSSITDVMFFGQKLNGVRPEQVRAVRDLLDKHGMNKTFIAVSSGFDPDKISQFEKERVPVDVYGVGQYLLQVDTFFCGDAVKLGGVPQHKVGRFVRESNRLKELKL